MPQRSTRKLAVFVHGFGSSRECWKHLLERFETDPDIRDVFDLECYDYASQRFEFNVLRRVPTLAEVSGNLTAHLERMHFDYDEITLVGHSQGGLAIQGALVRLLHSTTGHTVLERIRQVITIATPYLGSTTLSRTRKLLSHFYFFNPQERSLRVLDGEIDAIRREIEQKVVRTDQRTAETWPIPVCCFYGARDRVVPKASARGPFTRVDSLNGDHFTVLKPDAPEDYRRLRDALLVPVGHPRIWEVDLYEFDVRVEPNPNPDVVAKFGATEKPLRSESLGRVERAVTFSRKNLCTEPFEIRYRTRNDGFIKPSTSTENEAEPAQLAAYHDYGTEYHYRFTPEAGRRFWLKVDVYKGFEDGHRDVHFHLGRKSIYKRFVLRLDLTAYLAAGYTITREPCVYFHAHDPGDHALCESRESGRAVVCSHQGSAGVWEWELRDLRDGVVDAVWNVGAAARDANRLADVV